MNATGHSQAEVNIDDLSSQEIATFLNEHLKDMRGVHALNLTELRAQEITFWSARANNRILGCGALKELNSKHGEIKSMRTATEAKGQGIASNILRHIIKESENRGYKKLSLETGSKDFFQPARRLYTKHGFQICRPFANYHEDPVSVFMTMTLK